MYNMGMAKNAQPQGSVMFSRNPNINHRLFARFKGQGWSLGRNKPSWFHLSYHKWASGPKFAFEWHNYARINGIYRTDTHYVSLDLFRRNLTLWVPDRFLKPLLDRVPAYTYRKY